MRRLILIFLISVTVAAPTLSQTVEQIDARVESLSQSMSCPICEGAPLADNDYPLANDFKSKIRELIEDGQTDPEIRQYFYDRYGDSMDLAVREAPISLAPEDIKTRTEAVSKTLRCVVCQNQSIYDSNAPLAEDMRRLVQKRIEAGDTDEEAREYLRNLYGDYVLMSPPFQLNTILLWAGPLILILLGGVWFMLRLRGGEREPIEALSDEDRARVAAALANQDGNE